MAEGLVTFFKYKEFGFHRVGSDYSEPLDMAYVLDNLNTWYRTRTSLADTLLWDDETAGYSNRKKIYLKSIDRNEETGDYLIILWRAIGNGDGVYGLRSDAPLSDDHLYNADNATSGENIIWGEPLYYWFVPEMNIFASIKFPRSVSDTQIMNRYLKDFVMLHSTVRPKVTEEKEGKQGMYTSVCFPSSAGDNLWLRISSQQYTKITNHADLASIASEITHFVKREVISVAEMQSTGWRRLCGQLPFVSSESDRETRRIEVIVDAAPTPEQLGEMMETYHEYYNPDLEEWANLGFKKEGVGGICWLNKFVLKNVLVVSDIGGSSDESGHYSTVRLYNAMHLNRHRLLAPFGTSDLSVDYATAS
jgi:hypothetical protein